MIYELKNCHDGSRATYPTMVEISEKDGILTFRFTARNSHCHCAYSGYNKLHSDGDAVEVLIGSDPARRVYYEIELSPANDLMLARMEYRGESEKNEPILGLDFIDDCFVVSKVIRTSDGYEATMTFPKEKIKTGDGEIFFNAYRLDTDGVETNRHLFALSPTMRRKFHTPAFFLRLSDYVNQ